MIGAKIEGPFCLELVKLLSFVIMVHLQYKAHLSNVAWSHS